MQAKPYPRYKSSGVEWLGDVPEKWGVKRGRFVMRVNPFAPRLRALKPEDEVTFVPMEALGVQGGMNLDQTRVLAEVTSGYTEFQDGDVVVAKITPCFENGKAALANRLLNGAAYGTTELHVLRAKESLNRNFLFYLAISDTFRKLGESEMYGAGGQKRVPPEFAKDFRTPLPPPEEQQAIAAFLDRETGSIEQLVAKKRKLIERLKEKRTVLISRTVTRGLNPNCQFKPSGVAWIGDVPAHWELSKFGYLSVVVRGASPRPAGDSRYFDGDFMPWITVGEVTKDNEMYLTATETMLTEEGVGQSRIMHKGTLVLTNSGATLGVPKILSITGCANDGIVAFLNIQKHISKQFLYYYLSSLTENLRDRIKQGSGQPNLNTDIIKALAVPIPPPKEQDMLVENLNTRTARLDALAAKVETAVERLQEYRTALITAAVTGKIDVRRQKS